MFTKENLTWFIHLLILLFILFNPIMLPPRFLKYQMLIVPLIFIDWNDDGHCILTKLEHYFRTGRWETPAYLEGGPEFFRPILNGLTGKKYSREQASRINTLLFILSWLLTYYKLIIFYKI